MGGQLVARAAAFHGAPNFRRSHSDRRHVQRRGFPDRQRPVDAAQHGDVARRARRRPANSHRAARRRVDGRARPAAPRRIVDAGAGGDDSSANARQSVLCRGDGEGAGGGGHVRQRPRANRSGLARAQVAAHDSRRRRRAVGAAGTGSAATRRPRGGDWHAIVARCARLREPAAGGRAVGRARRGAPRARDR